MFHADLLKRPQVGVDVGAFHFIVDGPGGFFSALTPGPRRRPGEVVSR